MTLSKKKFNIFHDILHKFKIQFKTYEILWDFKLNDLIALKIKYLEKISTIF